MPEPGSAVAVGMSGGVDSTLTALLLKERGCRVVGITMSSWNNDLPLASSHDGIRNSCYGPDEALDQEACRRFCAEYDIEYHVIDVRDAYRREVLDYFRSEYRAGRTPNPCIRCNPLVKFGALLENAQNSGIAFDYFCTGHYSRVVRPSETDGANTAPACIAKGVDKSKDQSYFLYRITSDILERVRFPLGGMTKQAVFALARERGLVSASRSESQDFIPSDYLPAVFSDQPPVSGEITDSDGKVLGTHRGIENYTIGQRRGLGISAPRPLYVTAIDAAANRVIVGGEEDLAVSSIIVSDWVWPGNRVPDKPFRGTVKIRLAAPPVPAFIEPENGGQDGTSFQSGSTFRAETKFRITFDTPVKAAAPGQSAVIYEGELIRGGGIISRAIIA
jgi:tRNA-specific 2-thiouridylase